MKYMKHYKKLRYVLCVFIALNPLLVTYTHSMTIPIPVIVEGAKAVAVGLGSAACVEVGRRVTNFVRRHLYRAYEQSPADTPPAQQSQQAQPRAQKPKHTQASTAIPAQQVPQAPNLNFDSIFKLPFEQQTSKPVFDYSLQGIVRNASQATTVPTNTQNRASVPQATTHTPTRTQAHVSTVTVPSSTTFVHALPQPAEPISAASMVSMPAIPQVPTVVPQDTTPMFQDTASCDPALRDLALRAAYVKARAAQGQAQIHSQVYTPTETTPEINAQVPAQITVPVQAPVRTQTSITASVPAQAQVSSPEEPKIYWSEDAIRILAGAPAQTADQLRSVKAQLDAYNAAINASNPHYDRNLFEFFNQMSHWPLTRTGVPAYTQTQAQAYVNAPVYTEPSATSVPSEEIDRVDYQRDEQFDRYLERYPRKKAHYNQEIDHYISLLITVCDTRVLFAERYRALLQVNSHSIAGSWGRYLNRLVRKLNRFYFDATGALKSFVQDKTCLKEMENLLLHFFAYASKSKQQFNNCIQFAQSKGVLRHCRSQIRTMRDNLRYYNDRVSLVSTYCDALNGAGRSVVTGNIQNVLYREFARYATINSQLSVQAIVENAARAEQIFIEQQYAFPKSLTTQQMHTELTQLYEHLGSLFLQNGELCSASAPLSEHPHVLNPEGACEPGRTSTQQIPGAPPLDIPLPHPNIDTPDIKLPDHTCGTPTTPDLPKDLGPDNINPGDTIKPRPCNYSQMSDTPQLEVAPQVTDQTPQPDPDHDDAGITPEQAPQVQVIPVTTDVESDEKYIEEEIERILNEGIAIVEEIKKRFADNSAFLPDNVPTNVREKLKQQLLDSMLREIALAEERILENALQVETQLTTKELKDKQTTVPSFLDQYLPVVPCCLREIQEILKEKLDELIKGNIACINRAKQQALARGKPYIDKESEGLRIEESDTIITIIDAVGKVIERYRKLETGEWCRYLIPDKCQEEIDAWAEYMYSIFRNRDDIDKIAKNTGLPKHWIKFIKDHVFYNDHILFEGVGKFHANPEMASAWERLYQGDFIVNDIKLLEHEYFELKLEKWGNLSYSAAHKLVQQPRGRPWFDPKYLYYD